MSHAFPFTELQGTSMRDADIAAERHLEAASMSTVGRTWNAGMMSTIREDWATPRQLFAMLNREFHFDLDACATAETATCSRYLSERSLEVDWLETSGGKPVWMNPPYGRKIGAWIEKAYRESQRGSVIVCLLPARTDTSWFHGYCLRGEIRFLGGRLRFDDNPRMRAPFPSMIVIFRPSTIEREAQP